MTDDYWVFTRNAEGIAVWKEQPLWGKMLDKIYSCLIINSETLDSEFSKTVDKHFWDLA